MCAFCGQDISYMGPDPCQLVFVTSLLGPPESEIEQAVFCHQSCFDRLVHPSISRIATPKQYFCAFCGRPIAAAGFDPCGLKLITNWTAPRENQRHRMLFCHAECFRGRIRPGIPLGFTALEQGFSDPPGNPSQ